jgi:O-acetyl-ADP-ribose deacetylase (regulator of RNase III)
VIQYVEGDVTEPVATGEIIVAHVCNDEGRWGAGVSGAIGRRWPAAEGGFRAWSRTSDATLGAVQFVRVADRITVANMIAQRGIRRPKDVALAPIRYDALAECLGRVGHEALTNRAAVAAPRFGCGLAGGDWTIIEPMINQILIANGVAVTIYDFK